MQYFVAKWNSFYDNDKNFSIISKFLSPPPRFVGRSRVEMKMPFNVAKFRLFRENSHFQFAQRMISFLSPHSHLVGRLLASNFHILVDHNEWYPSCCPFPTWWAGLWRHPSIYLLIITNDILLAAPLPLGGPASGIILPFLPADHNGWYPSCRPTPTWWAGLWHHTSIFTCWS